ncbi:MAG TPA: acetate/propionate family kinase [Candidatus Angelobacter sp.]|jgi:acetate kinase
MDHTVLCLNGGSSSLKFAIYCMSGQAEERVLSGAIEAIGAEGGRISVRAGNKLLSDQKSAFADHAAAVTAMFAALKEHNAGNLNGAGHRIVHGGPDFMEPQRIDATLKDALKKLVPFAPLHLPSQVAMIEAVAAHYPDLPQVACFDTAFHSRMPEIARRFALPDKFWEQGIRRYGFHGLSYEFVAGKLGDKLGHCTIIAHLGNGASMVALQDGKPMDTSMGLTPTGGFMMGTRSGDLDPGVLLHLIETGYSGSQLEELLNHQSGLLGVSGKTSEMQVLLENRKKDHASALAVEMFCYQIRKYIGAYAAVLEGLDTLIFTGGIGEHAGAVRAEICDGLDFLGIALDASANNGNAEIISALGSRCVVRVVETDEDLMIARHTCNVAFQVYGKNI